MPCQKVFVGRQFLTILTNKFHAVRVDQTSNSEKPLIFVSIILPKTMGVWMAKGHLHAPTAENGPLDAGMLCCPCQWHRGRSPLEGRHRARQRDMHKGLQCVSALWPTLLSSASPHKSGRRWHPVPGLQLHQNWKPSTGHTPGQAPHSAQPPTMDSTFEHYKGSNSQSSQSSTWLTWSNVWQPNSQVWLDWEEQMRSASGTGYSTSRLSPKPSARKWPTGQCGLQANCHMASLLCSHGWLPCHARQTARSASSQNW